jgi:phage gp36-like protein
MAYATPQDLTHFYDESIVADLVDDGGEGVADLKTNPTLLALLDSASGRVESACSVASLYSPEDLAALSGTSKALLTELVCDLAMIRLLRRRQTTKYEELRNQIQDAEEYLDRLRKGERIFGGMAEVREAGLPAIEGPSIATYERLNLIPDRTRNFYPHRSSRLPIGRG